MPGELLDGNLAHGLGELVVPSRDGDLDRLIGLDDVSSSITITPDGETIVFTLDDFPDPWEHLRFSLHRLPVAGGAIERIPTGEAA